MFKIIVIIAVSLISQPIYASQMKMRYPEGFEHYFQEKVELVDIGVAGELSYTSVVGITTYDKVYLESESRAVKELYDYLVAIGLSNQAVIRIVDDFANGVETDNDCMTSKETCLLKSETKARYVYDYDNRKVTVFVPPGYIANNRDEVEYHPTVTESNALVNWSTLYAYTDFSNSNHLTFSNDTYFGLPYGFVNLDSDYKTADDSFNIYKAIYDTEFDGLRLQAGYSHYNLSFNSTDFMSNGANYSAYSAYLGTSRNLLKGTTESQQRIYFYAPQSGQIEVYRGERQILSKVVNEGKQYISYSDLPKGAYSADIVLRVNGEVIFKESRQIVNNNRFSLLKGETDFVVGITQFDSLTDGRSFEQDGVYGRAMVSHRLTDGLILGGNVVSNFDENYFQAGLNYFYGDAFNTELSLGKFDSGEEFYYGRISLSSFFVDYRSINLSDEKLMVRDANNSIASYLYGGDVYSDLGIGVSGYVLGGHGFVRYSNYDSKYNESDNDFQLGRYKRRGVNASWSLPLFSGNLSLNAEVYKANGEDQYRSSIVWTKRLGSGVSSQVGVYGNQDGFDRNINYLRNQRDFENWSLNNSFGASVNRFNEISGDFSTTVSGQTKFANFDAYSFLDDSGNSYLSGSMSGSQILSVEGVDLTNNRGRSFVNVNQKRNNGLYDASANPDENIKLLMQRDGSYGGRVELDDSSNIVALDDYKQYRFDFDDAGNNFVINAEKTEIFSHPGTRFSLSVDVNETKSDIIVLDNIEGSAVASAFCLTENCISVVPLSDDGVYQVTYKLGSEDYKLISSAGVCLNDKSISTSINKVICLPGIGLSDERKYSVLSYVKLASNFEKNYLYVGKFERIEDVNEAKLLVSNQFPDIEYRVISVSGLYYFYLVGEGVVSTIDKAMVESLFEPNLNMVMKEGIR